MEKSSIAYVCGDVEGFWDIRLCESEFWELHSGLG